MIKFMKYIKPINESSSSKIWAVIIKRENDTDFFRSMEISGIKYFTSELNAADYLIKYVNKYFNPHRKFEPMRDEDGTRFFLKVKENPDYKKALNYMKNYKGYQINIEEIDFSDVTYLNEFK